MTSPEETEQALELGSAMAGAALVSRIVKTRFRSRREWLLNRLDGLVLRVKRRELQRRELNFLPVAVCEKKIAAH
jgi:hypothetical protein